jgi:hypothetical protein
VFHVWREDHAVVFRARVTVRDPDHRPRLRNRITAEDTTALRGIPAKDGRANMRAVVEMFITANAP